MNLLNKIKSGEGQKVAIITGASRGVGKEIAIHLAGSGYYTVLLARDERLLRQVCQQIHDVGGGAEFNVVDVANSTEVEICIEKIIFEHERIDLLINNAAILRRGTIDMPDGEIEELLGINLTGAIYVAKHVACHMRQRREGYIINISSLGGKIAASFSGVYAASKFGLSGYSEALTKEMSLHGVKVTSICPSMIATDMANGRKFKLDQMIQLEDITKTIDYLLSLSSNAIPTEILISCMPLIEKTTESLCNMYLG